MSNKLKVLKQVLWVMAYDMADNSFCFWNNDGVLHISHSCQGPDGPGASVAVIDGEGMAKVRLTLAENIDSSSGEVLGNKYLDECALEEYGVSEYTDGILKSIFENDYNKEQFEEWMTEKV